MIFFALLGIWGLRRVPDERMRSLSIGLPIVVYSALLVLLVWGVGYLSRRHALAPWIPVLGFAAVGWRSLLARFAGKRMPHFSSATIVAVALVLTLSLVWLPRDLRPRRADRVSLRSAAEWVAAAHPDSGPVAALKLRTAYYAQSPFVPMPSGMGAPLESVLRGAGTVWVIVNPDRLSDHHGLDKAIGTWLERVHESEHGEHRAWVLRLREPGAD